MLKIKTTGLDEFLDPSGGSWVKALIMGNPGSGKTPSAAAWPDPIFADCERGLASVANRAVPYAEIKSIADMEALLDHLRKDSLMPPERRKYRTFVLDTIDTYQKIVMAERMRTEKRDSMTMQDWGFVGTKLTQLIERLLNLPMNMVINMHMADDKDRDGEDEILVKKAALKGALGQEIYGYFDLVGMLETSYVAVDGERTLTRRIRWQSEPRFPMLRARFIDFPKFTDVDFTSADYDRIFNAVTAGVDNLPETAEVEEIATEADGQPEPAPADAQGGPVENPEVPPKKGAKKTAKKAAASKKAEVESKAEDKPEPAEPVAETSVATEAEAKPVTAESETEKAEKAEQLLKDELGAEEVSEEPAQEDPGEAEDTSTQEEPSKTEEKTEERPPGTFCGDPVVANGTALVEGCGTEITEDNKSKVQISRLKYKTNLCDQCYEKHKAA